MRIQKKNTRPTYFSNYLSEMAAVIILLLAVNLTSCSSSDSEELVPDLNPGDVVTNFQAVKQYDKTPTFHSDVDMLVSHAWDLRLLRWVYFIMASNGFGDNEAFSASPDKIGEDELTATTTKILYDLIAYMQDTAEDREEALQRLEDSGVLVTPTGTRGIISDTYDFNKACIQTQMMGRKSMLAVMHQLGWTTNAGKMKEAYNELPAELRRGYTNASDFWSDFSAGKLDKRANQIFLNTYTYADPEFGEKARDMGITPGKNIVVAGAQLIEKGAALVIDASPIATEIGYGKDLFNAYAATEGLFKKGDVKGFLQNAAGNLINYGRDAKKLADNLKNLDIIYWEAGDNFWDLFGKDATTIITNEVVFDAYADGMKVDVPHLVKTRDRNGKNIMLVIVVDEKTGKTNISYVLDEDGNVISNPSLPGPKTITALDRKTGKRYTKKVNVEDDVVDVDMEYDEEVLEEVPVNGYIKMSPSTVNVISNGGSVRSMIITNYLYYTCSTKEKWLSAKIPSDMNVINVTAAKNDTEEERRGAITISATDSKGKVLKSTVLTVVQEAPYKADNWVTVSPSSLEFDGNGGKQEVMVDHSSDMPAIIANVSDDLAGWATVSWKETSIGWNMVVDVSQNDTGKERSGVIIVYAAANEAARDKAYEEGVFDPQQVVATTVLVKQAAASEITVSSIDFLTNLNTSWSDNEGGSGETPWTYKVNTQHYPDFKFSVSTKGDIVYIRGKGSGNYKDSFNSYTYECEISIDIQNLQGGSNSVITDMALYNKTTRDDGVIDVVELEAGNITYDVIYGRWQSSEERGMKYVSFYNNHKGYRGKITNYDLKHSKDNTIYISIFK